MATVASVLSMLQDGATKTGVTLQKYGEVVVDFQNRNATERSDKDTRRTAVPEIFAMFEANPDAELDPSEVAVKVGLKDCQADRAFVRHQWKLARLTYQPQAAE